MDDKQRALAYLGRDELLFMDMLELLRRGTAQVLYAGEDGVLLYDAVSGDHLMSAAHRAAADKLFALAPRCETMVGHEMWYKDEAAARYGFREEQICYQSAWTGREPPALPDFHGELRPLGPEWAPWIYEHYSHPFGGVGYMEETTRRGVLGLFVDGAPAGFVGFHVEGAIGLLEVLPAFRRRGYGEVLLRAAVRMAMERGQYPFGQVISDNAPSLALQRRAGMTLSEKLLFWAF